jgi:hypothetical protein
MEENIRHNHKVTELRQAERGNSTKAWEQLTIPCAQQIS